MSWLATAYYAGFGAFIAPAWMVESFPIIRIVLIALIALCSVAIVFTILMQPSNQEGSLGAIGGDSDTYFSKNQEKTLEGAMKRLTIVLSIAIGAMSILFFLTYIGYAGGI
ncbi:MAG: preprotein translocase subunit SecG [Firmicutes bacterium]|nr:preprotein translocase subunit SecG [Bacillota bacterium]